MKALLITHDFLPTLAGGIATYYYELSRELGDEISVLAPRLNGEDRFDTVQPFPVHRRRVPVVTAQRGNGGAGWRRLAGDVWRALLQWIRYYRHGRRLATAEDADVILIGHLHLAPVGLALRRTLDRPVGIVLHGSELHRYLGWRPVRRAARACLNAADFLVVNSEFTRRQYLELGVANDARFLKLNPGVDASFFRPDAGDPDRVRRRLGLGSRPVLMSVGRLVPWKGQDRVLAALPRILESVPEARYVIVGEGPHRGALEARVARRGLTDRVVFAGHVPADELPSYYRAADVVVVPTREIADGMPIEGFGIVFLEASACGVPVIGGRVGGTDESIEDGVTGFRVDPHDPDAIADAVVRILDDPDLGRRFGRAGRDRAVQRFHWPRQADRLREFLAGIVDER